LITAAINFLPDRRYMEEALLPAMEELQPSRLLDVGVDYYSRHYGRRFTSECEYWTLDLNPRVARFGSLDRHIVGDVRDLANHFAPGSIDVIMLNGVFGFGIDRTAEQECVVELARTALRQDGWLLIGWDRALAGSPLVWSEGPLKEVLKDPLGLAAIRRGFVHKGPPGLPARAEFADCSHVYDWFRRCR
jgi:SAM-dependent methyltransferase